MCCVCFWLDLLFSLLSLSKLRFRATFFPTFLICCFVYKFIVDCARIRCCCRGCCRRCCFLFPSILHLFYIIFELSCSFTVQVIWVVFIKFRSLFHMLQFFSLSLFNLSEEKKTFYRTSFEDFPHIRFWLELLFIYIYFSLPLALATRSTYYVLFVCTILKSHNKPNNKNWHRIKRRRRGWKNGHYFSACLPCNKSAR